MTSPAGQVPDAVVAAIQGYIDAKPKFGRGALGWLIVQELRRDGWQVVAPVGRPTTGAVGAQPRKLPAG
jgi:hypothetical protein